MITHLNDTYINSQVVLDDIRWSRCTFRGCELIYRGGGLELEGNVIENCRFRFEGAAEQTVVFMRSFAQDATGAKMIEEATGARFGAAKRTFTLQ